SLGLRGGPPGRMPERCDFRFSCSDLREPVAAICEQPLFGPVPRRQNAALGRGQIQSKSNSLKTNAGLVSEASTARQSDPPVRNVWWRTGGIMNLIDQTKATRRSVLRAGGTLVAATALPRFAFAEDKPAMGTWPAGSQGDSVTIGATVPRTGTYAVQGEDELKGMQLAVEHINAGDPLIQKISPKTKKGVLGKQVKLVVADSEAKPNTAVQAQSRFINDNKIVLMTGSTSSAVAVALNKLAQREHVLYAVAISGSNDTTGKD